MKGTKLPKLSDEAGEQPCFEVRLDSKHSSTNLAVWPWESGLLSLRLCSVTRKKAMTVTPVPEGEQEPRGVEPAQIVPECTSTALVLTG